MDIGSGNGYPSASLSNFAPHPFEIDGIKCNSMEGFLQSLKFESVEMQRFVCTLVGKAAKFKGKKKKWYQKQELYWNGKHINEALMNIKNSLTGPITAFIKMRDSLKLYEQQMGVCWNTQLARTNNQKQYLLNKSSVQDLHTSEIEVNFLKSYLKITVKN